MNKRTLELAAKAAGQAAILHADCERWNPLQHAGDAWRLADAIGATVDFNSEKVTAFDAKSGTYLIEIIEHHDSLQAALVQLAARIGESMQ